MQPHDTVTPWHLLPVLLHRSAPVILRREHAPLGRVLSYRRGAGGRPCGPTPLHAQVLRRGWQVDLGGRGLGDVLLGLSLVKALIGTRCDAEPHYQGQRAALFRRCEFPMEVSLHSDGHVISASGSRPVSFEAVPESPSTWIDDLGDGRVEVHADLPMRYYLHLEQALGVRLPEQRSCLPAFSARSGINDPFHVVFVTSTSWPDRKDYGAAGFSQIAIELIRRRSAPWRFSVITADPASPHRLPEFGAVDHEVHGGLPDVDCLDLFGSAAVVIGNDTGLTHLAALCTRPDGQGPHVIGLYGRHSYAKWTTGAAQHHAVATAFSQMMAVADACPVRDNLDDSLWDAASNIHLLPAERIAWFAGHCAEWW